MTTHSAVPAAINHRVDGVVPTVTAIAFVGRAIDDDGYGEGEFVQVDVTFSEPIALEDAGQISLVLELGDEGVTTAVLMRRATTPNSTTVRLSYTVRSGDVDTDGLSVAMDSLSRGTGDIVDAVGNPAVLDHDPLAADSDHAVDGVVPNREGPHDHQHARAVHVLRDRRRHRGDGRVHQRR